MLRVEKKNSGKLCIFLDKSPSENLISPVIRSEVKTITTEKTHIIKSERILATAMQHRPFRVVKIKREVPLIL